MTGVQTCALPISWKGVGLHGLALDHTGIAIGGFLARCASIHQGDIEPSLLQMQSRAGADHTGTDHHNGRAHGVSDRVARIDATTTRQDGRVGHDAFEIGARCGQCLHIGTGTTPAGLVATPLFNG